MKKTMTFAKDCKSGILHVFADRDERDAWVQENLFSRVQFGEAWIRNEMEKGTIYVCHGDAFMPRCFILPDSIFA